MLSTFKSMVREDTEFGDQPPNMINYTPQFLQALVKIALHRNQNKVVDKNEKKQEYHKQQTTKLKKNEKDQKTKMQKLREQFDAEEKVREEALKIKSTRVEKSREDMTLQEQKRVDEKEQAVKIAKKEQSDIAFQRWLKQKGNNLNEMVAAQATKPKDEKVAKPGLNK